MKRICIFPKDVQWITGMSDRQSRNIILKIKKLHNKEKHQPVTIDEFCQYMGFNKEDIAIQIK
jgi:hypothetical protein